MVRKSKADGIERLRMDRSPAELEAIRRKLARWAKDSMDRLRLADPDVPEALNDRQADNFRPLLAVADLADGTWPILARQAAVAISTESEDDTYSQVLLEDLRKMFAATDKDRLSSAEIVKFLGSREDRPWTEWGRERKPITPRQLAVLLKPFSITPATIRIGPTTAKGYSVEQFADAFQRYLSPVPQNRIPNVTTSQANTNADSTARRSGTYILDVTDTEALKANTDGTCDGVTDRTAETATEESEWVEV